MLKPVFGSSATKPPNQSCVNGAYGVGEMAVGYPVNRCRTIQCPLCPRSVRYPKPSPRLERTCPRLLPADHDAILMPNRIASTLRTTDFSIPAMRLASPHVLGLSAAHPGQPRLSTIGRPSGVLSPNPLISQDIYKTATYKNQMVPFPRGTPTLAQPGANRPNWSGLRILTAKPRTGCSWVSQNQSVR